VDGNDRTKSGKTIEEKKRKDRQLSRQDRKGLHDDLHHGRPSRQDWPASRRGQHSRHRGVLRSQIVRPANSGREIAMGNPESKAGPPRTRRLKLTGD
jgi:hypothetical protein